jgi:hypothetical protein
MTRSPKSPPRFQLLMNFRFLILFIFVVLPAGVAAELPFDPAQICRLSVDDIPRSIAIRQGTDVWLGYDLEKALVFKVWQAPGEKPGLILRDFKAVSAGTPWFEEQTGGGWKMKVEGKDIPLTSRYLGCTQNKGSFELRWELSHSEGTIKLSERIPMTPPSGADRAYRELRVESLAGDVSVVLPSAYRKAWVLTGPEGKTVTSLAGSAWHRLSLP